MQMETLKRILIKTCSKPMQPVYTRVPVGAFPHKFDKFINSILFPLHH